MLAALALASGLFTTLFLGARSELRLRQNEGTTPNSVDYGVDVAVAPYARLETRSRTVDFKFAYAAELTQPDLEYGFTQGPQLFQMGDLSLWYVQRHWMVGVSQGGSFGDMNVSYLVPYIVGNGQSSGPPPIQLVPCTDLSRCADEVVSVGSSATSVTGRYRHRRTTLSLTATYTVSGGLDEASIKLMPVESVPQIDLGVEHLLTRRDKLRTEANASAADSTPRACNPDTGGPPLDLTNPNPPTCAPRAQWMSLRETWSHRITRRWSFELTGGATVSRSEVDPSKTYGLLPYPVVGALFGYALQNPEHDRRGLQTPLTDPPRPSAYAYTRVAPTVDTHWGIVDPRFEIGAAMLAPLDDKYALAGRFAFARSLPPTALDATYVAGEAQVFRRLDKYRFEVGAGLRGAYQDDPFTGRFYVLTAFLSFVWHEPRISF
jgi:hypothetical protein